MNKKEKIFFDESLYNQEVSKSYEIVEVYKKAKKEVEAILEVPLENFEAFKEDALEFTISGIKKKYPGVFALNLPLDKTLQMLSIDLDKLKQYDAILKTTPHKINVCKNSGDATPCEDQEPFFLYAETTEQLSRLKFANELVEKIEKCHEFSPYKGKHNLVTGLTQFMYLDPQKGFVVNHFFVLNGIPS
jgi:hypothetical protein